MLRKEQHIQNKKKTEQKEEESLNLFNKIEAEKNHRLNIDENSENEENKERFEDATVKKVEPAQIQKEASVENISRPQDNSSKDRTKPIIMDPQYENKDPSDVRKPHEYEMKDTKLNHSTIKSNNEIILKLVGISPDWTVIKINIIFNNPSKPLEITFDFDLRRDTSEGVVGELEQAFPVSKSERNQIKNDIDKIVYKAVEKIRMTSEPSNGSTIQESKTPKNDNDTNYQKPQPEEINDGVSIEYAKNLEKAQYLIHHFIATIDQEVKTMQRNQSVLEEINQSAENEATNLSLNFINNIIDSYNSYQYQMSKSRASKTKGGKPNKEQPLTLKQGKSFKAQNVSSQVPKVVSMSTTKSVMVGASPEIHGQSQHAAFYMNQKDYSEEPQ